MKKVLLSVLCVSFVAVMSCGGSGTSGTPADANSTVAGAAVSSCLAIYNPGGVTEKVGINEDASVPIAETIDCADITGGVSGTLTLDGTMNISASDTSFTINGSVTEVMADCTVTDTACDFGNVVGNGTLTATVDGSGDSAGVTFTEVVTGDLTFDFKAKSLACPVNLTLSVTPDTSFTEEGIKSAITGTVCGADWASINAALSDATTLDALCTAWSAAATNI